MLKFGNDIAMDIFTIYLDDTVVLCRFLHYVSSCFLRMGGNFGCNFAGH